jgi:hypothetical protein
VNSRLRKAREKWIQFRIESALRAGETQSLIVNLALIRTLQSTQAAGLVVFVETLRDALLIRFLGLFSLIPRVQVVVIHEVSEALKIVRDQTERRCVSVMASRLFIKYYQHLVEARRSGSLVIV